MMAYAASYEPSGSSFPNGRILEGVPRGLALEDPTPDGGAHLNLAVENSGRRVVESSVPRKIMWQSRREMQDFEGVWIYSVSERLRDLIEGLEPATHQFVGVDFVNSKGLKLPTRYFWQICNRLDGICGDRPGWHLTRVLWERPTNELPIFDKRKIGNACFWQEKHFRSTMMFADRAMERFNEADISGFKLQYREER